MDLVIVGVIWAIAALATLAIFAVLQGKDAIKIRGRMTSISQIKVLPLIGAILGTISYILVVNWKVTLTVLSAILIIVLLRMLFKKREENKKEPTKAEMAAKNTKETKSKDEGMSWWLKAPLYILGWGFVLLVIAAIMVSGPRSTLVGYTGTPMPLETRYHFTKDQVPAKVALPIIGGCETGGRNPYGKEQHYKDGSLFLNEGIPQAGINPSGAFGKRQVMPLHIPIALKMKLDIVGSEADYDTYTEWLYNEQDGTHHWEHDEEYGGGYKCWGEALEAIAIRNGKRSPSSSSNNIAVVQLEDGYWSNRVYIPFTNGDKSLVWESIGGKPYFVKLNGREDLFFSSGDTIPPGVTIRYMSFRTSVEKPFFEKVWERLPFTSSPVTEKTRMRVYFRLKSMG